MADVDHRLLVDFWQPPEQPPAGVKLEHGALAPLTDAELAAVPGPPPGQVQAAVVPEGKGMPRIVSYPVAVLAAIAVFAAWELPFDPRTAPTHIAHAPAAVETSAQSPRTLTIDQLFEPDGSCKRELNVAVGGLHLRVHDSRTVGSHDIEVHYTATDPGQTHTITIGVMEPPPLSGADDFTHQPTIVVGDVGPDCTFHAQSMYTSGD